jgi:quinolinate synthase
MIVATRTASSILADLRARLSDVVPDAELAYKAELAYEINELKREKNAVILGHNYMEPALFASVCDHTGDSLELSRVAASLQAERIVFCGVRFMAETAKILSPGSMVLLPSSRGGCSLASSITAGDVRRLKESYPGVPIVTYVNTYAEVKAESDICCTSGNAARIVASLDSDVVICLPDEYLARNVARETGKRILFPRPGGAEPADLGTDALIGWDGRCEVHDQFTPDDVAAVRAQFPDVVVLAHPECSPEVVARSDFAGSTAAMLRYVREIRAPRYLLLTECSMADNIVAELPDREMVRLCSVRCPHMNEVTMEEVLAALTFDRFEVEVPQEIRERARLPIERMLAVA